jgi:sarcosine oxidase delta subunit
MHTAGCKRWFIAERHTGTNEIRRTSWPQDRPSAGAAGGTGPQEATLA